jgi:hypothetical protein
MLLRIACCMLIASLWSCSKDPTTELMYGSISFSANGSSYSWFEKDPLPGELMIMSLYSIGTDIYYLSATNEYSSNLQPLKRLALTFPATTITPETPYTYTISSADDPAFSPLEIAVANSLSDPVNYYDGVEVGDFATVTITSIHDKRADGRFIAKLRRESDGAIVDITNGKFKNIEFVQ